MRIVIMDGGAANPGDLSWSFLEKYGEVICYEYTSPEQTVERASGADICLTNKTVFDADIISKLPSLKYIGVLATGFNVVDLDAATKAGIVVTNIPEYATFATAQHTIALLLELSNRVGIHNASVQNGEWIKSPAFSYTVSPLTELSGKTIAVVGLGKIGLRTAQIASSLGMNVIGVPHKNKLWGTLVSLPDGVTKIPAMGFTDALPKADVLTFHCPLTPDTKGLLNDSALALLKDGAFVINTSRGPVIDEKSVAEAIKSGKIKGFACDVLSNEPMASDNPLFGLPNTIITPHIAWAPKETRERLLDVADKNINSFIKGRPVNKVN